MTDRTPTPSRLGAPRVRVRGGHLHGSGAHLRVEPQRIEMKHPTDLPDGSELPSGSPGIVLAVEGDDLGTILHIECTRPDGQLVELRVEPDDVSPL